MTTLLEELCTQLRWKPADGPAPGVWLSMDPGCRCIWTCLWATDAHRVLTPDNLLPIENLTRELALLELDDAAHHGRIYSDQAREFLNKLTNGSSWPDHQLIQFLQATRPQYPEYVALWDLPSARIIFKRFRPGWGKGV